MDWLRSQTKVFRAMLYCYPAEFRHEYGTEMAQLFADRLQSEPRICDASFEVTPRIFRESLGIEQRNADELQLVGKLRRFRRRYPAQGVQQNFTLAFEINNALVIGTLRF